MCECVKWQLCSLRVLVLFECRCESECLREVPEIAFLNACHVCKERVCLLIVKGEKGKDKRGGSRGCAAVFNGKILYLFSSSISHTVSCFLPFLFFPVFFKASLLCSF